MAERPSRPKSKTCGKGEGDTFTGEGILAITKALLENGVGYVGGYQGAPISHLMDVLADAEDLLGELGRAVRGERERGGGGGDAGGKRALPDPGGGDVQGAGGGERRLGRAGEPGIFGRHGGALIIVGEDYGEGSSIMQERSHAFAMKSQFWLLDPRPNLPCIVKAVGDGFELSEASNTPVMLMVRIRACHVTGSSPPATTAARP
jgi:indolepyruvate ferredoxin oxidoreductase, alpha subunit